MKKQTNRRHVPIPEPVKVARRTWVGVWVQFDPGEGTGLQIGVVSYINVQGEVYVSYNFDEYGCYTLPVCLIEEIPQALRLVVFQKEGSDG